MRSQGRLQPLGRCECVCVSKFIPRAHGFLGQIIATLAEVTGNGSLVREYPPNALNSGLGITVVCPDGLCQQGIMIQQDWLASLKLLWSSGRLPLEKTYDEESGVIFQKEPLVTMNLTY